MAQEKEGGGQTREEAAVNVNLELGKKVSDRKDKSRLKAFTAREFMHGVYKKKMDNGESLGKPANVVTMKKNNRQWKKIE